MQTKEHVPNAVPYAEPEAVSVPGISEPKINGGASVYNVPDNLPSQAGNDGKFLATNGSSVFWSTQNYAAGYSAVPGTTGIQYVTDIGFKPKMVVLHGVHTGGGSVGTCDGVFTDTFERCRDLYFNNAGPSAVPYTGSNAVAFYLQDPYSTCRAVKDSLNAGGFSLNWTSVGLTSCSYHWEAFG